MSVRYSRAKYPYPVNSLGEMICLGCGRHFAIVGTDKPSACCSRQCGRRVKYRGGRWTCNEVQMIVTAIARYDSFGWLRQADGNRR